MGELFCLSSWVWKLLAQLYFYLSCNIMITSKEGTVLLKKIPCSAASEWERHSSMTERWVPPKDSTAQPCASRWCAPLVSVPTHKELIDAGAGCPIIQSLHFFFTVHNKKPLFSFSYITLMWSHGDLQYGAIPAKYVLFTLKCRGLHYAHTSLTLWYPFNISGKK